MKYKTFKHVVKLDENKIENRSLNKNNYFRCYTKKKNDIYVSVCIDLCLSAQSDTFEDSKFRLIKLINSYVADTSNHDSEFAYQLLNRKAPFSQFVEYYFIKFITFYSK